MAADKDSNNPEPARPGDSVGFIVDGIDLRDIDADEIEFHPLESFAPDESFEPDDHFEGQMPPPSLKGGANAADFGRKRDAKRSVPKKPASSSSNSDSKTSSTTNLQTDSKAKSTANSKTSSKSNSKMPAQLWPSDEELQAYASGAEVPENLNIGATVSPEAYKEFFDKNVVRQKNFRLTANNMIYYPQLKFGSGVKYSGTMTLSQTAMLILAASKTEALRQGRQEIGCEHVLLALLANHGFAAGQLMLSLHLNAIGKPYALGDLAGTARKVIDGPNPLSFDRMSAIARGGAVDMCFTAEADQMLVDAMYAAAKDGVAAVGTKHILSALNDCDNEEVQAAFGALYVTRKEIQDALKICPDDDDLRQFAVYALCSILYAIIRVRIFQAPIKRYSQFAIRKEKMISQNKKR